jgi:hypothetical protein
MSCEQNKGYVTYNHPETLAKYVQEHCVANGVESQVFTEPVDGNQHLEWVWLSLYDLLKEMLAQVCPQATY